MREQEGTPGARAALGGPPKGGLKGEARCHDRPRVSQDESAWDPRWLGEVGVSGDGSGEKLGSRKRERRQRSRGT